jgi:hypothetical protein
MFMSDSGSTTRRKALMTAAKSGADWILTMATYKLYYLYIYRLSPHHD